MSNASQVLQELFSGVFAMGDWTIWVMLAIGAILIWLGVRKGYEPVLLFPMGVGCILANIPGHFAVMPTGGGEPGFLTVLYNMGIANELFPVLIFIGIGAMCDFTPLIRAPYMMLFAAAAHLGIFAATLCATLVGFPSTKPLPSGSSAPLTAPPPFSWPRNSPPRCWLPLPSPPSATCPWCPLSSLLW